jgi:hypothetical protein
MKILSKINVKERLDILLTALSLLINVLFSKYINMNVIVTTMLCFINLFTVEQLDV